ncbi:Subtilisin-like serine protease [ANME-1 cluster archaeon GoMg3.2]|nr:Subtilisin-like serine protease [ANME-1 cluster archaeon GoMg3.2]
MAKGKIITIAIAILILMTVLLVPHVLSMDESTFVTNGADVDGRTYESSWNASSEELIPVIIQLNTDATVVDLGVSARRTPFELAKQEVSSFTGAAELRAMSSGMSNDRVRIKRDLRIIDAISADVSPSILDGLLDSSAVKRIFPDEKVYALLDTSVPLINATAVWLLQDANGNPVTGKGVVVAILDTGVDYTHPALGGCKGFGCKVIDGYDIVNDDWDPMDNDGHGTMVAGIIAANGALKGVAPDAELRVYKVLEPSEYGPASGDTSDVIAGIDEAIKDEADIICMSLGGELGVTDTALAFAVSRAVDAGVIVVAAAGNDGPWIGTIYSPASYEDVIAVGSVGTATMTKFNLEVVSENKTLDAYHMQHSPLVNLSGELAYAGLGYPENFSNQSFTGKIALIKRGGLSGDSLYFYEKVRNAYDAGAIGVVIFNNELGLFRGELADENETPLESTIPAFSLSQKDGNYLLDLKNRTTVVVSLNQTQDVDYDTISFFSSFGPGSGYTIKPDILAPGAGINSTAIGGGYNATHEGTSLAAPHVAGACALLLQLHPDWTPEMIKAALMNTAQDLGYSNFMQGAGRVDVLKAATVDFIALPPSITSITDDYANAVITVRNMRNYAIPLNVSVIREEEINFDFGPANVTSPINIDITPTLTLGPGESRPINLYVTLPEVQSNVHFCGSIAINSTNTSITVPFAFRRASQIVDSTIQSAVRSASAGATILVPEGDYRENVKINMPLHIRSLAGPSKTSVTAANPYEPVFEVNSDDVTISGFAISGGDVGIKVDSSRSSTITNNSISKSNYGIQLYFSDSILVENNMLFDCSDNIDLKFSNSNWILRNNIANAENGILLQFSDSNKIANNTVQENDVGIAIEIGSKDNIICNNNMLNNTRKQVSIQFSGSSNVFSGNYWSDYEGNDSDNDGIGDTPYQLMPYLSIKGGVEDKQPYMQENGWLKDD